MNNLRDLSLRNTPEVLALRYVYQFVSPLFDLAPFHAFADDNQIITTSTDLNQLKEDMEARHEIMTKWLRESGLIVNEQKTEFHCDKLYSNQKQYGIEKE